ncbi:hypothetical protein B0J12DRAFT_657756 [Macrophomina phaseolina]|uniref:Uncharacterized protein n=1 Tax=Macrophomina phaseolina TaxID=35725 RepID=A0ABQ8GIL7_9PEZI|nr:hypothetical protein B0J12DRAFT_657756 [Macrophomina phaseolina]
MLTCPTILLTNHPPPPPAAPRYSPKDVHAIAPLARWPCLWLTGRGVYVVRVCVAHPLPLPCLTDGSASALRLLRRRTIPPTTCPVIRLRRTPSYPSSSLDSPSVLLSWCGGIDGAGGPMGSVPCAKKPSRCYICTYMVLFSVGRCSCVDGILWKGVRTGLDCLCYCSCARARLIPRRRSLVWSGCLVMRICEAMAARYVGGEAEWREICDCMVHAGALSYVCGG